MASYYGLSDGKGYRLRIDIGTVTQSIINNTSSVPWALYLECGASFFQTFASTFSAILDGTTVFSTATQVVSLPSANSSVLLASGTQTINHNPDGSKTLNFSGSFRVNVVQYYTPQGTLTISESVNLPTIPRATLINSFNDFQIENTAGAITGNAQVYANTFYHRYKLLQGSTERASWDIGSQAVGVYAYVLTLTNAQRDAIFGAMPTIDNQQFTLQLITYGDAARTTQIGSTQTKTATGTIPASYKPSITTANSNFSWTNKNSKLPLYLIQNVSTLTLLLSGGSVPTGATLSEYKVRFGTITRQATYTGAAISQNVGLIPSSGTLYAYYSIKDSRGRWSAEISETLIGNAVGVQAYNPPINNGFAVRRNTAVPTSADYILKFANSLYSIGNTWTYTLLYWNGTSWATAKAATAIAAASIGSSYTHALPYSESLVYNVKVVLTDQFNAPEYTDTLSTSAFPISWGSKGCGFGKDTSDTYNIEAGALGISSDGPIVSTVAPGTAPLVVVSTTVVSNLNSDMIGGKHLAELLLLPYPIGSVYISIAGTNPGTIFGGTWVAFATGRTLLGIDGSDTDFNLPEKYGGNKMQNHPLSALGAAMIGSPLSDTGRIGFKASQAGDLSGSTYNVPAVAGSQLTNLTRSHNTSLTGVTDTINAMPPYMVVYMWKRTA